MHPSRRIQSFGRPTVLSLLTLEARDVPSVSVRFDYGYDTAGFFSDPARRASLEHATAAITSHLQDSLAAIAPAGVNTWQAQFYNPATKSTVTLNNPVVKADELVVYIGATPLGGSELGQANSGGFSATGTRAWLDVVKARGQAGALSSPKTDFATWGGMVTFDSRAKWNAVGKAPAADEYDFESVALHEMMHVFGFGLGEAAFTRNIVNGVFIGPAVLAANGGVGVPTESDPGQPPDHFAQGTNYRGQESPMQPSLAPGIVRHLTPLDYGALNDIGWNASGAAASASTPIVATPAVTVAPIITAPLAIPAVTLAPVSAPAVAIFTPPAASPLVASALAFPAVKFAAGAAGSVSVYGQFGEAVRTIVPFGAGYTAGVRVATADLNGDGTPDLIAATGPGVANQVKVYDGRGGDLIAFLQPFEASFTGGLNLAVGDLTGDGRPDLVVTPDVSGGPVVAVYDGAALSRGETAQVGRFYGLDDPNFRGGVRPAVGDLNGDGRPDLAVAAGEGGGPRVALYDGRSIRSGTPTKLTGDFFAYDQSLRNGVFLTIADLTGDGFGELIAGGGPGGAPRVTAFDGRSLAGGVVAPVVNFFAGDVTDRGGVRLAALDLNGDGRPELLATVGSQVRAYTALELANTPSPSPLLVVNVAGLLPAGDAALSVG